MDTMHQERIRARRAGVEPPPFIVKTSAVRCGQANQILSQEITDWFRRCLGCVVGRREFLSNRYFAVEVRQLQDVIAGWRHFLRALEHRETVACLYVIPNVEEVASMDMSSSPQHSAREAMAAVSQVMSVLSDKPPHALLHGGQLNQLLHLTCPVTACRTAFSDFDAVAFVPQADNVGDPLYDPLMAAPVPMVNINSDIYAFSMFTRDHALNRFDCEIPQLTKRERGYLFAHAADSWQRMAERTIENYAAMVDQSLCPTFLTDERDFWIANHKDPAFAEVEKCAHLHEMPVHYTGRIIEAWSLYFDRGVAPDYRNIAVDGVASERDCPHLHPQRVSA